MNISPLTHLSLDSEENQTSSWEFCPWNKELFILIAANTQTDVFWGVKFLFQKNSYFSLVSTYLWSSVSVLLVDIIFYLITLSNVKRKENLSLDPGKWELLSVLQSLLAWHQICLRLKWTLKTHICWNPGLRQEWR